MNRLTYLLACCAMAMTGSAATAAVVEIKSDTSWLTAGSVPGAGWNSDLGFNDGSWAGAVLVPPATPVHIWAPGSPATAYFRSEFDLVGEVVSGALVGGADDDAIIWINGMQVLNDKNGRANDFAADITAALVSGRNLIAVQAFNLGGPAAFRAALSIETVPSFPSVPEPATWALMIGGFALAGAALRRTRAANVSFA